MQTHHTLGVRRRIAGSKDARNNPTITYGASAPWQVHSYAPGAAGSSTANNAVNLPNRDLSLILWTVYAPANGEAPTELDLVVLDGVEYAVEGRPGDWTNGPHPFPNAGLVVELKRAEG